MPRKKVPKFRSVAELRKITRRAREQMKVLQGVEYLKARVFDIIKKGAVEAAMRGDYKISFYFQDYEELQALKEKNIKHIEEINDKLFALGFGTILTTTDSSECITVVWRKAGKERK